MTQLQFRQSELTAFKQCRRSWALQYRAGLERKRQHPSKAGVGTLVHLGLELGYSGATDTWGPVEALWEEGRKTIEDRPDWLPDYDKMLNLTKLMLDGYWDWVEETGADVGHETVGIERQLSVPFGTLQGVEVIVTGKADREYVDEFGDLKLMDHKTVDALTVGAHDGMDPQRMTYAVLRLLEDGSEYRGATHNKLRRVKRGGNAKPPFYGRHEVHFSRDQLRKHYRHMQALLQEMVPMALALQTGALDFDDPVLYPHVTRDCDWRCPFIDICPLMDDGSDWQWLRDEIYAPGTMGIGAREGETNE